LLENFGSGKGMNPDKKWVSGSESKQAKIVLQKGEKCKKVHVRRA
jgi:hypothetical protein